MDGETHEKSKIYVNISFWLIQVKTRHPIQKVGKKCVLKVNDVKKFSS